MEEAAQKKSYLKVLVVSGDHALVSLVKKILSEVTGPSFIIETCVQFRQVFDPDPSKHFDAVLWDAGELDKVRTSLEEWKEKKRPEALLLLLGAPLEKTSHEITDGVIDDYLAKGELSPALLSRVIVHAVERKRAGEKLDALADLELEFVRMISHEIRAPLAIVKESVSLVLDKILGKTNEKQQHVLLIAKKNISRIDQVVMNLVSISKIEAHRMELKKERVDLVELVKKTALNFSPRASALGFSIRLTSLKEKIEITADKQRLLEVLNHLVGNAVKFTEKGSVEIRLTEAGNKVECAVQDTGLGISDENQPKIFGKFQQFGWVPGGGEKGMGLGLAVSKGIIELHGGKIKMESQLGQGSTFSFELPAESYG